jgi:alkanesulfonate monooxygenase SsuD/methylene tetrahydromethanopterin reductase-like flavin-dependent oxidoreductase (luciferase family)
VALYRATFRPSEQQSEPYVLAGVNVIAADDAPEAQRQFVHQRRARLRRFLLRPGVDVSDEEVDRILDSPQGASVAAMLTHTAVGTGEMVAEQLAGFARFADADELVVCHQSPRLEDRLRSVELTAKAVGLRG